MSVVVDGADQMKFELCDLRTHTKAELGHEISVHFVGVMIHAVVSNLRLFTMTDEHATVANHMIEATYCFIISEGMFGSLLRTFLHYVHKGSRGNKNK